MRAVVVIGDKQSPEVVANHEIPRPVPSGEQVLVKVHAAGITGDELTWPELYKTSPCIPGHDISGTIVALGPSYNGTLDVGQEVFGMLHADRGQGQADYAIGLANELAPKPTSISHAQAAALPIPLLTAWEALDMCGQIAAGTRVLVTGASGAVGQLFVQLASQMFNAHVIALTSSKSQEALVQLGASEVLDYNTPGWEQMDLKVNIVFDTVGEEVLAQTWNTVAEQAIIITVADPPPPWAFKGPAPPQAEEQPGVAYKYFIVSPSASRLGQAASLIDRGSFQVLPIREYAFEEAAAAWAQARQRNRGHKVVLCFDSNESS